MLRLESSSAAARSLPETRVWASRLSVPHGIWSQPSLTRSSHQGWSAASTTLASECGKYTQPDPLGLHGGLNIYGYTKGNPIIDFDPLGLCCTNKDYFNQLLKAYKVAWSVQQNNFFNQLFTAEMWKSVVGKSSAPTGCGLNADTLVTALNAKLTCWEASRVDAGPKLLGFTCQKLIPHSFVQLKPLDKCCDAKYPGIHAIDNYYGWPSMAPFPDATKSPF